MLVPPVPNSPTPPVATATILKLVRESLSGISTLASPFSFRATFAFQNKRVSNNSRVICLLPPPPTSLPWAEVFHRLFLHLFSLLFFLVFYRRFYLKKPLPLAHMISIRH